MPRISFASGETTSRVIALRMPLAPASLPACRTIHAGTSGICYTDLGISYWQPRIYGYGRIVPAAEESPEQE